MKDKHTDSVQNRFTAYLQAVPDYFTEVYTERREIWKAGRTRSNAVSRSGLDIYSKGRIKRNGGGPIVKESHS